MKSIYLPTSILTWILVLSGMWIIRPGETNPTLMEYVYVGAIVGFFVISIIFLFKRHKRRKSGVPEDDELSRLVDHKSFVSAYFASLCIWLVLILLQNLIGFEMKLLVSIGIIGMAYSYIISWLIINSITFKDEK